MSIPNCYRTFLNESLQKQQNNPTQLYDRTLVHTTKVYKEIYPGAPTLEWSRSTAIYLLQNKYHLTVPRCTYFGGGGLCPPIRNPSAVRYASFARDNLNLSLWYQIRNKVITVSMYVQIPWNNIWLDLFWIPCNGIHAALNTEFLQCLTNQPIRWCHQVEMSATSNNFIGT